MSTLRDFERAWPHLEPAVERARQHTKESVYERIALGRAQLWVLPNSAAVTTLQKYHNGRRSFQIWLLGGELHEIQDWAKGEALNAAVAEKCDEMRVIGGRRGWLRAFGWRDAGNIAIRDFD